ncbi:metal-dependent hydrolase [Candidatus Nitrosotalea bavarica]|uniref:metal-dependent hydrolase n=1 Tax=Candidatus Nitrosotalea bavarica TaxID=1903277 RepID=UPI000C704FAE|nr:metal-dependent hydrolase [Candidatus Nitrosotalea bavarica]
MKIQKQNIIFVVSVSLVYCAISAGFSLVGTVLPDRVMLLNPIEHGSLSVKEIGGHFVWGLVAGIVTLRLRYILLGGILAVLIDSDHLIGLLHVEAIPRMSHSVTFAILSTIILLLVFSKKDYRLGAIAFTSVLTHISYDMFADSYGFPIFTPFVNKIIQIPRTDWIVFEIAAICIIGIVSFIVTRKEIDIKKISKEPGR